MAEDGPITVASAVIVPGETPERASKRRTSSSTMDGSKRPRISRTSGGTIDDTHDTDKGYNADGPSTARKWKSLGGDEVREQERKRGQRLFGALLGTIGKFQQDSQSARAKAGANRRKEVEDKLQQKLRQQNEELDEKKRRESTVLREKMRQEQRLFEGHSLELKHANLRGRANYLCTKSKPPLYYLPWKLTEEEEARIHAQLDEAEATIEREREDIDRRRTCEEEVEKSRHDCLAKESTNVEHHGVACGSPDMQKGNRDEELDVVAGDNGASGVDNGVGNAWSRKYENTGVRAPDQGQERRRSVGMIQEGGEVVIEAGEDTVIY